jgi:hypothetical protein
VAEEHVRAAASLDEATEPQHTTIKAPSRERETLLQTLKIKMANLRSAKAAAEQQYYIASKSATGSAEA